MLRRSTHLVLLTLLFIVIAEGAFAAKAHPKLTMEKARAIATLKEPGKVKSQELEREHGRLIYSFDIEKDEQRHEVNVDANTGEIIEDSVEDAAAERRERAEEAAKKAPHTKSAPQT